MRRINPRLAALFKQSATVWHKGKADEFGAPSWTPHYLSGVYFVSPIDSGTPDDMGLTPAGSGSKLFWVFGVSDGAAELLAVGDIIVAGVSDSTTPPEDGDRYSVKAVNVLYGADKAMGHVEVTLV